MICIYHSRDIDGWMSAAIVKLKYSTITLIGWDYGQSMPELNPEFESDVIMVDVSFPAKTMGAMQEVFNLTWIDHHISAIKDVSTLDTLPFIEGKRNDKFAACELTWQYFFPDEPMPELVRLLGRYDCFGHKGTDEERKVLEFQYGARDRITNVETALINLKMSAISKDYDDATCKSILKDGQAIYSYLCTEAKQTYSMIFPVDIDGYKFACVNQVRFNPINFGIDYHKDGYDGFACFHFQNGQFTYSLYNDNGNVDCSELCKRRGGGGHKGAAGFRTDKMLYIRDETSQSDAKDGVAS
jgi:oligoribonuclease NrnB/cAMP/cGMP phosphodiesterase (DHH superfamily)